MRRDLLYALLGTVLLFTLASLWRTEPIEPASGGVPGVVRSPKATQAKIDGEKDEGEKPPQHPGELARERFLQRADENGKIPVGAIVRAKERIDEMREYDRDAGIWEWEWLGPGNIGGRIRTILPHPTNSEVLWIGSVSGGIWKTENGGSSWAPVDDFMANLAVTSLVMASGGTDVLYAATGEGFNNADALPGAGIFKSTDGGVIWNQLSSTNNASFQYVNRLAADPLDSDTIWAVTTDPGPAGTVWKTTDAGDTWNTMLTTPGRALDIKVHQTAPSIVLVGTGNEVYLSTDAGVNWTLQTTGAAGKLPANPSRCEVALTNSLNIMYVSMQRNGGEIWRTTNAGIIWSLRNTGTNYMVNSHGTNFGWYANALWVDPTNSGLLVVGSINLYKSPDGGNSLIQISEWPEYHHGLSAHADQHAIVPSINFANDWVVYFGNDGGIQRADDIRSVMQTSGWTNLANNLGITQFFGGAAYRDGSLIVGGSQDNDKLRYLDGYGTGSWYQAETGDGGYAAVRQDNPLIVYGEYVNLQIEKSTNGGATYFDAVTGLTDAGNSNNTLFIAPFVMDPNDNDILIAGGSSIWQTTDGAANWSSIRGPQLNTPLCSAIDVAKGNSNLIWVGYNNGTVAMTTNGGLWWNTVSSNGVGLPTRFVTDIAINPVNNNEVFVTFSGYVSNNVWMTSDAGSSWQQRSGTGSYVLPALQVNTVRHHPQHPQWVYIGTDLGVFASEDKGITWSTTPLYAGNEGPVNVEVDELFFAGQEVLVAATHGRGMYRCRPLTTVYVDGSNIGSEDGTQEHPYNTVQEGIDAAGNGTTISIEAGNYDETVSFQRRGSVVGTNGPVTIGAP